MPKRKSTKHKYEKPVSLYPLSPEKVIADVFKIDQKKFKEVERSAKRMGK